ncbi:MAG: TIM44-like domain-containing protein [Bacilli bacterium]|nr:TIM44-like domain-containing protein [Bacilli bacterium]
MKNLKKLFIYIILSIITIPVIVNADSGFDSNYGSGNSSSFGETIMSVGSSGLSFAGKLLQVQPNDKDYQACHIILSIICIIILYIVACIYIFKLDGTKKKNTKKVFTLLGIGLIPTLIFSLFSFLTNLQLILYIFILLILIIPYIIVSKNILKKRLKNKILKVEELDKNFNKENISKELFNIYKDIQIAWMDFNYKVLKDLLSKEIYEKYEKQLEELKSKNQKNIMDNIEFKKNKITDIDIDNNIETIECEMSVTCIDYIIENDDKLIKGKKDKFCNYTYKLVFNKDLSTNKYTLIEKKIIKQ